MPQKNPFKIAIIGGGASATLLLAHLAIQNHENIQVDVYDRSGSFARGIAYSSPYLCHLLNVRAANMSGLANHKDHFSDWIKKYGYQSTDFAPRKLYGEYLEALWNEAEKNLHIQKRHKDVTQCTLNHDGYVLNDIAYNHVILATGNVRPLAPAINGSPPQYYPDPWQIDNCLKTAKSIALLGSGLTAVDTVLTLLDMKYSGKIKIFSRHASWPMPHTAINKSWILEGITPGLPPSRLLKAIRINIQKAKKSDMPWQAVIDAIRPITNDVWQKWTNTQKNSFHRHLLTIWNIHRHRIPPSSLENIKNADITFISSRVKTVTREGLITESGEIHTLDAVINCMGYRYNESERHYEVSHKIGPARFGELFETTAIPEIRAQADKIAQLIGHDLNSNS